MANVTVMTKTTYQDNVDTVSATKTNEIQDKIIELETYVNETGEVAKLDYTVVSTF